MSRVKRVTLWALIAAFICLILSGSVVARPLWETVNKVLGGMGMQVIYFFYGAFGISAVVWLVFLRKERKLRRYFLFVLLVLAFAAMFLSLRYPEERIHLFEFGGLAVMFYYAFKEDMDLRGAKLYVYAFLACAVIGILDEVVQYFVPGRVCDVKDMVLNAASGLLALQAVRFLITDGR